MTWCLYITFIDSNRWFTFLKSSSLKWWWLENSCCSWKRKTRQRSFLLLTMYHNIRICEDGRSDFSVWHTSIWEHSGMWCSNNIKSSFRLLCAVFGYRSTAVEDRWNPTPNNNSMFYETMVCNHFRTSKEAHILKLYVVLLGSCEHVQTRFDFSLKSKYIGAEVNDFFSLGNQF
jgi:hypothetical protein